MDSKLDDKEFKEAMRIAKEKLSLKGVKKEHVIKPSKAKLSIRSNQYAKEHEKKIYDWMLKHNEYCRNNKEYCNDKPIFFGCAESCSFIRKWPCEGEGFYHGIKVPKYIKEDERRYCEELKKEAIKDEEKTSY